MRASSRSFVERAIQDYLLASNDAGKLLWYARKTEILGNFTEAVAPYTEEIKRWPDNPRFPRFRGQGHTDETELYASSGPRKDKMGFSSFHRNVWYHLGFSHFSTGNHMESVDAYQRCMKYCDTKESVVATSHWIYMFLLRLGRL